MLLKIDWRLIISVITLFIVILTFIITYFRGRYSVKLSIKKLRLPEPNEFKDINEILLKLIVHFNNKGLMLITVRDYDVEFDDVELVKSYNKWLIVRPEDIKLQPKQREVISFVFKIKGKKITDKNEWKKIGSGKKIRFRFKEDNSGKKFKSKKVKFEDILED